MRIVEQPKESEVVEEKSQQTKIQEIVVNKPTINSPWLVKEEKPKKKGWWIFKIPIFVYLLLSSGYVYLSTKALSVYLNNPISMYLLIGLHIIIIIMFIILCIVTKKD